MLLYVSIFLVSVVMLYISTVASKCFSWAIMQSLEDWEKSQVKSIDLLFDQATDTYKYFEDREKGRQIEENELSFADQLKFRSLMFDLYGILDYTYFLLYCHFFNEKKLDLENASRCTIPCKSKGVKNSKEEFILDEFKFLSDDSKVNIPPSHIWNILGEILYTIQSKSNDGRPVVSTDEEESFALLHYFRNRCTHTGFVSFELRDTYFTDKAEPVYRHQGGQDNVSYQYGKLYWIQLPTHLVRQGTAEKDYRLLLPLLKKLRNFVDKIVSDLLSKAVLQW